MNVSTPERIVEIAAHIQDGDYDWIRKVKENYRWGVLDHEICDAIRSMHTRTNECMETLFDIATLRGWRMTVVFMCNLPNTGARYISDTDIDRDFKTIERVQFWYGMHKLMVEPSIGIESDEYSPDRYYDPEASIFNDSFVLEGISSTLVTSLRVFFDCNRLLQRCLENGWVQSATYIVENVCTNLIESDNTVQTNTFLSGIHQKYSDIGLYRGITACIKTQNSINSEIIQYNPTNNQTNKNDDIACRLMWLFLRVAYLPTDYKNILMSADVYNCVKLKELVMQQWGLSSTTLSDLRRDTQFVKRAALRVDVTLVRLLVEKGYALNSDTDEQSVVHDVIEHEYEDNKIKVLTCLHECGADFRSRDSRGASPIHIIAVMVHDWIDLVEFAAGILSAWYPDNLNCCDKMGRSPLHYAAHFRNCDIFIAMYKLLPFDLHLEDTMGFTPLHELARAGDMMSLNYVTTRQVGILQTKSKSGMTLLDAAAQGCRKNMTRYLLEQYAMTGSIVTSKDGIATVLNEKSHHGESALFIACKLGRHGRVCGYVDFLMRQGASLDTVDNNGNTLVHAVAGNCTHRNHKLDMFALQGSHGVGVCLPILQKITGLELGRLVAINHTGSTPLDVAVNASNEFVVASLLFLAKQMTTSHEFKHFINNEVLGKSPLLLALQRHQDQTSDNARARYMKIAEMLLGSGACVDSTIMRLVQTIRTEFPRNNYVLRVTRLAVLRQQPIRGRLAILPLEIFERMSLQAVYDNETQKRLAGVNDSDSEGHVGDVYESDFSDE